MDLGEDSPLRKPILTIKKSGEKAIATVQDLLALARRGAASMEVVNINHLIDEYMESPEHRRIMSHHPAVRAHKKLEEGDLNILGSPYHLAKTVLNLVMNSAEAMPEGGDLSISTESRHLDWPFQGFELIEEGDYVVLTVSDTGEGIPADSVSRLFEPFYTKKRFGRSGTGLGLPVVWGTVKDHGGYVDVSSVEGRGTSFILYFPVTRQESPRDRSFLSRETYRGRGEKILVVDDILEQREIASMILTKLGYEVASVSSGEEAVEYMRCHEADLLILDMIMDPGIDGLETYKRILKIRPGQKAVITSGFSETKRVREAQELGATTYIRKPYFLEKIGLAARKALDDKPLPRP
jgi:CheY-like chemotaxis protein